MGKDVYSVKAYSDSGLIFSERTYWSQGSAINYLKKQAKYYRWVELFRNGEKIQEADAEFAVNG